MKRSLLIVALIFTAFASEAQHVQVPGFRNNKCRPYRNLTIGFRSGSQFSLGPKIFPGGYTQGMFLRSYLNSLVAVECGLNYNRMQEYPMLKNNNGNFSAPVSVQYFPLGAKYRFRPYIGAGCMGNGKINNRNKTEQNNIHPMGISNHVVDMILSQGMLYELNTHIMFNQSFHFIPTVPGKSIGFDVGIGYSL